MFSDGDLFDGSVLVSLCRGPILHARPASMITMVARVAMSEVQEVVLQTLEWLYVAVKLSRKAQMNTETELPSILCWTCVSAVDHLLFRSRCAGGTKKIRQRQDSNLRAQNAFAARLNALELKFKANSLTSRTRCRLGNRSSKRAGATIMYLLSALATRRLPLVQHWPPSRLVAHRNASSSYRFINDQKRRRHGELQL